MNLEGKQVLVAGSGISGTGAVKLLLKAGAFPVLYDEDERLSVSGIRSRIADTADFRIILGTLEEEVLDSLDLIVMSPGIPLTIPMVQAAKEKQIPIWGEIELAYQYGKGTVLAVTGTNGKTTTTALLGEIMRNAFEQVFVVGNIGTPYTEAALRMTKSSVTVAEISSFQLETIEHFRPSVSAVLNITPDHLNRHHTFENYVSVKKSITRNQGACDTCVLNFEDEELRRFGKTLHTKVLFFSSRHTLEKGIFLRDGLIIIRDHNKDTIVCSTGQLLLLGRHNYENVMAAVGMAYSAGVSVEIIRKTVTGFEAVEHRIEYVTEKSGVRFYNDSKGTNPDAAIKAIQAMNRPTLLIAGGYDKDSEYGAWIDSFGATVKMLILIGATREKIEDTARKHGFENIRLADTLEEAVTICADHAVTGDAVLLSPACASWGMFKNYEVRGKVFKELVNNL